LSILRRSRAGNPNGSNDLTVDEYRNATFERGGSTKAKDAHVDAPLRNQIFEHFARPTKIEGRMCFVFGNGNRAILRVVELV